MVKMKISSSC